MSLTANNLLSALENPQVVDIKLGQELAANHLAGPFSSLLFQTFCVSPLGLVPKKALGDFGLIHHVSHPQRFLINDGIAVGNTRVHYSTVADAIRVFSG